MECPGAPDTGAHNFIYRDVQSSKTANSNTHMQNVVPMNFESTAQLFRARHGRQCMDLPVNILP
jgi:hypothetical protein